MLKFVKTFSLNILVLVFLLELFSFTGIKFNFFSHPSIPSYGKSSSFADTEWRNERELWGAWHKKNFLSNSKKSCFDVTYKTNNIGARDNINYYKNSGGIVLLGDSFIEGVGVNLNNTFALKLRNKGNRVLNFGSAGDFGPLQEFIIYNELISKYDHEEIIIFFLPANDFTDNSYKYQKKLFGQRYRPYFRKNASGSFEIYYPKNSIPSDLYPSSERKKSFIIKKILIDYFYSANILRQFRLSILGSSPEIQKIFNNDYGYGFSDEDSINGVVYYYEKLFKLIPSDVVKTFIIIPTDRDLREIYSNNSKYLDMSWYKKIKEITAKNDITLIDLALNKNNALIVNQRHEEKNWFLKCDGHWSKEGHQYAVERYLQSKK